MKIFLKRILYVILVLLLIYLIIGVSFILLKKIISPDRYISPDTLLKNQKHYVKVIKFMEKNNLDLITYYVAPKEKFEMISKKNNEVIVCENENVVGCANITNILRDIDVYSVTKETDYII
jgi:hypothetical protein